MPEPQYRSHSKLAELTAERYELRTVRKPASAQQINAARTRGGGADDNADLAQYQITGSLESDPAQGKISHRSPIGKNLLGKRAGDVAEMQTLRGDARIKVIAVR